MLDALMGGVGRSVLAQLDWCLVGLDLSGLNFFLCCEVNVLFIYYYFLGGFCFFLMCYLF